jgi:hypothetical protein
LVRQQGPQKWHSINVFAAFLESGMASKREWFRWLHFSNWTVAGFLPHIHTYFIYLFIAILEIEPRTLSMLGK